MYTQFKQNREIALVTGASGYVATHLVRQLQEEGYRVRGTVRSLKNEERVAPLRKLCPAPKFPIELVEADLMDEKCWDRVVEGCTYVYHTASPFPSIGQTPGEELIETAVKGTTNVLNACAKYKVKRVVLTSSFAAIGGGSDAATDRPLNEEDWTNPEKTDTYSKSKTLAEKAAWDLLASLPEKDKFELVVLNPTGVYGPPLCGGGGTSMDIIMALLMGAMPMTPAIFMGIVDVRDLANAHIRAMNTPAAKGKRFLTVSKPVWFKDMAQILSNEFKGQGYDKIPLQEAPNAGGPYSAEVRLDNSNLTGILKIDPRPIEDTLIDMAYAMIDQGRIPPADGYKGRVALVTGASGYVATHLVRQLQEEGYRVRGTVRSLKNEERVAPLRKLCPAPKFPVELVEADLTDEKCWDRVVEGCTYVYHTASPFPSIGQTPGEEIIETAVKGTTNVLNACAKAKVKRVVLTSSFAAIGGGSDAATDRPLNEEDWTNPEKTDNYSKSKTLAEKAAWDLVASLPEKDKFELVVLNPTGVYGPPLCGGGGTSMDIIMALMMGAMPMTPAVFMGIVDVRDVAKAHIRAMNTPAAKGKRFLTVSKPVWFKDMAQILSNEFKGQGYDKIPLQEAPNAGGPYSAEVKLDNSNLKGILKINPRPIEETLIDMAYAMIDQGRIPVADGYKGRDTRM